MGDSSGKRNRGKRDEKGVRAEVVGGVKGWGVGGWRWGSKGWGGERDGEL